MLNFKIIRDQQGHLYLATSMTGKTLLAIPQLNKGTAFTLEEREQFGLIGKLPHRIETLDAQAERAYWQYSRYQDQVDKNIYLNYLLNANQTLFYKLLASHAEEMLPMIYTPVVGHAVRNFNEYYMHPRGLYIGYEDQDRIEEILQNRSNPDVKLVVVSDGEGVLGIGDQGIAAMAIPIAKLMVYTSIGGINPNHTLPILLDAGTNNQSMLNDPFYLGWRHPRISGKDYDRFIDKFICALKKVFPYLFLHWEDFGRHNAYQNLAKYREKICSFNDDIQGTGVVATAAILAAIQQTQQTLDMQRIIIFGAGSAGIGIAENICKAMIRAGLSESTARKHFWLIDKNGLLTQNSAELTTAQQPYARTVDEIAQWGISDLSYINLETTIATIKPTILIGTSAQTNAFTRQAIITMAQYCQRPIILPLSNPPDYCEADPADLITWTEGRGLIATGSPFEPVNYQETRFPITQCNNYLAFPGIGLGAIAVTAHTITDNMLWAASETLSHYGEFHPPRLLPTIGQASNGASRAIAIAVAKAAVADDVTPTAYSEADIIRLIDELYWHPTYLPYQKIEE